MTIREIHNYILSLFLRGLGVWLLFGASDHVIAYARYIPENLISGMDHSFWDNVISDGLSIVVRLSLAGYFMLGAPPFLKWATQANPPVDLP